MRIGQHCLQPAPGLTMKQLDAMNVTLQNVSKDNQLSDSTGLVSEEVVKTYLNCAAILLPLVAAVCLVACFLNIAVNSMQRRDAYTYYLTAMNIGDCVYLCCTILIWLSADIWGETKQEIRIMNMYLNLLLTTISRNFAVVLNALASMERFFVLVFPFRVSANLLNRFPRAVIALVFCSTVLGHVSLALEFQVKEIQHDTWAVASTKLRLDNYELFLFFRNFGRIVFFYAPLVVSLIMNTSLVVALYYHAFNQRNIRAIKGKECSLTKKNMPPQKITKTSRLILILTFSFFLLALPRAINATVSSFVPSYGYGTANHSLAIIMSGIADLSAFLSELFLLIVSTGFSAQFGKSLCRLLRCQRCVTGNCSEASREISANSVISGTRN